MPKIKVINKGERTRDRLGKRFLPNKEVELEVSNKEFITIKAVKDFEVEIIEEEKQQEKSPEKNKPKKNNKKEDNKKKDTVENTGENTSDDNNNNEKTDEEKEAELLEQLKDANVEDFLNIVDDNNIDIDKAIAIETANKNRVTLIDELEQLKAEKGE